MSRNSWMTAAVAVGVTVSAVIAGAVVGALPANAGQVAYPVVGTVMLPAGDAWGTVPNMAVDEGTNALYGLVSNGNNSGLSVVDLATNAVTKTILLDHPGGVAIDAGRGLVYVTVSDLNAGTSSVAVFSTATNTQVATIPLGQTIVVGSSGNSGIGVDTATGSVYVLGMHTVGAATTPSMMVLTAAQISTAIGGTGVTPTAVGLPSPAQIGVTIAVDSAGGVVYVGSPALSGSVLYAFSASTNALTATIPVDGLPNAATVDSSTGTVYVSQRVSSAYSVGVIPRGASAVASTIALPAQAESLAVDPTAGTLYAAVAQPFQGGTVNEMLAIGTASKAIVAATPLPTPADVRVNVATGTVYVSGASAGNTTITELRKFGTSRVAGSDRYATSVAVSKAAFPGTAPVVYIASGANYPDALAAGPAAAKRGGPLLLTTPTGLTADVSAEVGRLKPSAIVVVGGAASVSDAVLTQLKAAAPSATVSRAAGDDRFATSRAVVSGAFTTATTVYLASGSNFPDALSAGGAAGAKGAPIVLVDGAASAVDPATSSLLASLKVKNIALVGGASAVSAGVAGSLTKAGYTVTRLAGSDRYGTALAVNGNAYSHASTAVIATGFGFPDALAATSWAGQTSSPLYLAPGSCVPRGVLSDLGRLGVKSVTLVGGLAVLTSATSDLAPCSW